jgi:TFIIF-interacting CTD phosphatase-like protein
MQIIVYTASLSKYADPLLDILDPDKVRHSFFSFLLLGELVLT